MTFQQIGLIEFPLLFVLFNINIRDKSNCKMQTGKWLQRICHGTDSLPQLRPVCELWFCKMCHCMLLFLGALSSPFENSIQEVVQSAKRSNNVVGISPYTWKNPNCSQCYNTILFSYWDGIKIDMLVNKQKSIFPKASLKSLFSQWWY